MPLSINPAPGRPESSMIQAAAVFVAIAIGTLGLTACGTDAEKAERLMKKEAKAVEELEGSTETATFGAGCFWCIEAALEQLDGVASVTSGYMGGHVPNPTYRAVCADITGHAEVVQVVFEPKKISYETLLDWFWKVHDPTSLNRQGLDAGTQYRSVIFYHDERQRELAEQAKAAADTSDQYDRPIVTEISPAEKFYRATDDHQNFYRLNPWNYYNRDIIAPKLEKIGLDS